MRYKKHSLIARRNKILPVHFVRQDMSTYAGLTLIDHYLKLYQINIRLKQTLKSYGFKGDYGIGDILFIMLIMILVGAERLQHIDYLKTDPLFSRIVRLTRIPHRTKLSTALKQFTSGSLKALAEMNSELVVEKLTELGLNEITVDLDGTVISTKGHPSWAFKGYNPIKRGASSYFPLTAHVGETGHFLSILNRPGNVHDSNRALVVIQAIRRQLTDFSIRFRADSAFCVPEVINYLLEKRIGFAIKAPFWKLLNLKTAAQQRKRWFRINNQWGYFWIKQPIDSIDHEHYVIILRKEVKKPKVHYQLQLFSPDNGSYEYSAVVTDNKTWKPKDLLTFVSGRSAQENSISELKTSFAFDHIPTNTYQANSVYMQMSQMAYNLSISMQHSMGISTDRDTKGKSTRRFKSMKWKTFRFLILNRAGRIAWRNGTKVIELTKNNETELLYRKISTTLNQIEFKKAA
jgi:hypothetical protein